MSPKRIIHTKSAKETIEFGKKFARSLEPGTVVALSGELGSGKTTLVKGLALGLGVRDAHEVHSPTFVIFHIYKGRIPLYHFDLYRLASEQDLDTIGAEEFLSDPNAISVVEWADKIPSVLKSASVQIALLSKGTDERTIRIHYNENKRKHSRS